MWPCFITAPTFYNCLGSWRLVKRFWLPSYSLFFKLESAIYGSKRMRKDLLNIYGRKLATEWRIETSIRDRLLSCLNQKWDFNTVWMSHFVLKLFSVMLINKCVNRCLKCDSKPESYSCSKSSLIRWSTRSVSSSDCCINSICHSLTLRLWLISKQRGSARLDSQVPHVDFFHFILSNKKSLF